MDYSCILRLTDNDSYFGIDGDASILSNYSDYSGTNHNGDSVTDTRYYEINDNHNNGREKSDRRRHDAGKKEMSFCGIFVLVCFFALLVFPREVHAAFPTDMGQRPVLAHSVEYGTVSVYSDRSLEKECDKVPGEKLKMIATKVSKKGIFGKYTAGDQSGDGWFSYDVFVEQPDYENVYATVRDAMYAYTDSSFSEVLGTIGKYTGIIVISREEDARQVIYETEDGYQIGWMTAGAFSNTLLYDGRDKQMMADGEYYFESASSDSSEKMTEISHIFSVQYVSDHAYYIKDSTTGKYLSVCSQDGTAEYGVEWTSEKKGKDRLFQFYRMGDAFALQSSTCRLFLAQEDAKKETLELTLTESRREDASHWTVRAVSRMVNTKSPMVFTQYDPQWCATPYGGGGCMGTAGCGVLAAVNAVYALSGQYMDVMELADYAVEKNYRIVGSGTDDGIFRAACKKFGKKYGFAWDGTSGSIEVLKQKLDQGDTAIVHVQGHYVSIAAYSKKKNRYLLLDSNYLPKRATSAFGDWISTERLLSGTLESQMFYFYKLR